jgi:hypothetical protein
MKRSHINYINKYISLKTSKRSNSIPMLKVILKFIYTYIRLLKAFCHSEAVKRYQRFKCFYNHDHIVKKVSVSNATYSMKLYFKIV